MVLKSSIIIIFGSAGAFSTAKIGFRLPAEQCGGIELAISWICHILMDEKAIALRFISGPDL